MKRGIGIGLLFLKADLSTYESVTWLQIALEKYDDPLVQEVVVKKEITLQDILELLEAIEQKLKK